MDIVGKIFEVIAIVIITASLTVVVMSAIYECTYESDDRVMVLRGNQFYSCTVQNSGSVELYKDCKPLENKE